MHTCKSLNYIPDTQCYCTMSSERGSRALRIYKRDSDKKEPKIQLNCLWHYSRYTILIINSHPFSFDRFFFSIWLVFDLASFLSFVRSFDSICSFIRLCIDSSHVHYDCVFPLCINHIYSIFFLAIILYLCFPIKFSTCKFAS